MALLTGLIGLIATTVLLLFFRPVVLDSAHMKTKMATNSLLHDCHGVPRIFGVTCLTLTTDHCTLNPKP